MKIKDFKIITLLPQDFSKCSNIWDLKKHKAMAEKFYNELVSGERITFVYIENEEYIGEVSLVFDNEDRDYTIPSQRIYLSRLIVKNEYRRHGIGTQLCEYAFQYAKENGYIEVSIGVDLDNFAALKLYQRLGFDRIIFVGEDTDGKYIKLMKIL